LTEIPPAFDRRHKKADQSRSCPEISKRIFRRENIVAGERKMLNAKEALMEAHRNNIRRYNNLLRTHLTDVERSYVQSRLSEEKSALQSVFEQNMRMSGIVTQAAK
jgi:hypothetical protein